MTVEAPRELVCDSCGTGFTLSARTVRVWRSRGQDPLCRRCQHPPKPVDLETAARLRQWWLDRYPLEELREMAGAIASVLE
jgi:hypothetical protein